MGEKKETTPEQLQSENLRLTTQITVLQDQVNRQENEIARLRRCNAGFQSEIEGVIDDIDVALENGAHGE